MSGEDEFELSGGSANGNEDDSRYEQDDQNFDERDLISGH